MKKIISLFQRNYTTNHLVRDEVVPGAEWVINGEGVATRKWDGTCTRIKDNKLWKRLEVKKGKIAPIGFEVAQEPDTTTGDCLGWVLVGEGPEDRWFREGFMLSSTMADSVMSDGTYELCGPKINGNPEKLSNHLLISHGNVTYEDCPRTFNEIKEYLNNRDIEGIVWWHSDGRMVKIKKKDFGMKR